MKERMVLTMEFHSYINEIGGNRVLTEMVQNLRARTIRAFSRLSRAYYPRSQEEHLNLLRAIVDGDADKARQLSEYHLKSSKAAWMVQS
jgi:DNA-binding FadR family transcriptional regulator